MCQNENQPTARPLIEIDSKSGFCFGVVTAIKKAEAELEKGDTLYCLGDIVHNNAEVERLTSKGLQTITHQELATLSSVKVLLRAHGEPPSTYAMARDRGITIIDATCPVVLRLQQRIKDRYDRAIKDNEDVQIVIYGRIGHAEVNGLVGQTDGHAIVIENVNQLDKIDFTRDIALYSQTTKSLEGFKEIITEIKRRIADDVTFEYSDTICRQVASRVEHLCQFASSHDVILFVAGEKSSNGKILFDHCHRVNPNSYIIAGVDALNPEMLRGANRIGICGATSTPRWLMEDIATRAAQIFNN
jgi:4-hydroxy-3-methylbut-2-enyl diphosphate reductase